MLKAIFAAGLILGGTFGTLGGMIVATPAAYAQPADPFDQRSFPCAEDEVLGYAPQFGPDRVGCIHIDELTR